MAAPLAAAAIAGGAGLAGQAISAFTQGNQNKKNRAFAKEMWEKQNAVNDANWHRDNAYNAPSNQRKLYEQAGLNPALLYDSGGGFQSASSPAAPTASTPNTKAPELDLGSAATAGISAYYDAKMRPAQLDNLEQATTNAAAQSAADVGLKTAQTAAVTQDVGQKHQLFKYASEAAEKANRLTDAQIENTKSQSYLNADQRTKIQEEITTIKDANKRANALHEPSMQQLRNNIKYQTFKAQLNDMGFTENDSVLWRLFGKWGGKIANATSKDLNRTPKPKDLNPNNQYQKGQ